MIEYYCKNSKDGVKMLEIFLLGTGGTMPMPKRALTSLYARLQGHSIIIDCGEGTQVQIRKSRLSLINTDAVLFTHFHADHISGLPGLLLSMGNDGRVAPLKLVGPAGLKHICESLKVIIPDLPFDIVYGEITGKTASFDIGGMKINAFKTDHGVSCYGYSLNVGRTGKFDSERAMALDIDKNYWNILQKGQSVSLNGNLYTPDMVLGQPRKGIRACYVTDTRPNDSIVSYSENADLLICEGMYGDNGKYDMAKLKKHMLFGEAAEIALKANVKELWLTHFSPSLECPEEYIDNAKNIFNNTVIPSDIFYKNIDFPD